MRITTLSNLSLSVILALFLVSIQGCARNLKPLPNGEKYKWLPASITTQWGFENGAHLIEDGLFKKLIN